MRLLPLAPAALLLAACHRPPHADEHLAPPPPSASATTEPAPPAPLIDLIDRRPETAWSARVRRLLITAGYDRVTERLFAS